MKASTTRTSILPTTLPSGLPANVAQVIRQITPETEEIQCSYDVCKALMEELVRTHRFLSVPDREDVPDREFFIMSLRGIPIIFDKSLPQGTIYVKQKGSVVAPNPDYVEWTPHDTLDL
jgi:hypothetical protein